MSKWLQIFLGVLTAIGGFVDIGELVAASQIGARFQMNLAWVVGVSLVGAIVFVDMAGRIAVVAKKTVVDIVREELGDRMALVNVVASFIVTAMTLVAELGGVALSLELIFHISYLLFVPIAALLAWFVIWKVNFELMENIVGILGLALVICVAVVFHFGMSHVLWHQTFHPAIPQSESAANYWYFAVALFGAGIMPYEVFFFSSGAIENKWKDDDLVVERANVYFGFPLGALVTLALIAMSAIFFAPQHVEVEKLLQVKQPVQAAFGSLGLATILLGFFVATFGSTLETTMSCGYLIAQHFKKPWGSSVSIRKAGLYYKVIAVVLVLSSVVLFTKVDPIKVTEFAIVFSALAIPLTYAPLLFAANSKKFMKRRTNGLGLNIVGGVSLLIAIAASLASIPLIIITKAGGG